jgi:stearoyl-CoA desaturase (delta-9 desaturase)
MPTALATRPQGLLFPPEPSDAPLGPDGFWSGERLIAVALVYAHVGWLFRVAPMSTERYATDMLRDPDLVAVSRWFPTLGIVSLALPFALGFALTGTLTGALVALVRGRLVRMALLHHVTWRVNSLCHAFGERPFDTRDESCNQRVFALVSFGDSWHKTHHALLAWARYGALRGQIDLSARFIRTLEQLGWTTNVRWSPRVVPIVPRATR